MALNSTAFSVGLALDGLRRCVLDFTVVPQIGDTEIDTLVGAVDIIDNTPTTRRSASKPGPETSPPASTRAMASATVLRQ